AANVPQGVVAAEERVSGFSVVSAVSVTTPLGARKAHPSVAALPQDDKELAALPQDDREAVSPRPQASRKATIGVCLNTSRPVARPIVTARRIIASATTSAGSTD